MSKFRTSPRALNLRPRRLDQRLKEYGQGIRAASAPEGLQARPVAPAVGVRADWFKVVAEQLDHIQCTRRDNATETYLIAKDPDLALGLAVATLGGEPHRIIPPYTAGSIIWGLAIPGGVGIGRADGEPYEWIDMNTAGRQWAREPT